MNGHSLVSWLSVALGGAILSFGPRRTRRRSSGTGYSPTSYSNHLLRHRTKPVLGRTIVVFELSL